MLDIRSMAIKVYNTYTQKKEELGLIEKDAVKMYVCGVTVYGHCHIGHARSAVVFDVIQRYLASRGLAVTSVKNFTDIDDKIIRRSHEEGIPWQDVGEKYIASFHEDMDALNIQRPTFEPRATDHIDEMIELVETLLRKGNAYQVDEDVYFSVESFAPYGQLSKRPLEDMVAGARVDVDDRKRNPLDFALWKGSKEGEPFWETPFGKGRPGWHIECSVMSTKYLGNPFDIHGGGRDLVFPHHENERAQTEAATGRKFVNYWIHNGFVNIEKEKMSKSIGNILLIKDFLKDYHPEVLRLFFLSNHYRSPLDYNERAVQDAHSALQRLYHTLERVRDLTGNADGTPQPLAEADDMDRAFQDAMDDDFNTALALSHVFDLLRTINRLIDEGGKENLPRILYCSTILQQMAGCLGFFREGPEAFQAQERVRHLNRAGLTIEEVDRMVEARVEARKAKDFKKADELRDLLLSKGIILLDSPKGTEWRIKSTAQ